MKNRIFSEVEVQDYIWQHETKKYAAWQLAQLFKVTIGEMRTVLTSLENNWFIKSSVTGKNRLYFKEKQISERHERYSPEFRPLKGYEDKFDKFIELCMMSRR